MKTVGITGRSGCGKSSVTALLRAKGYPVIDGDELSREILQKGSPCLPLLQEAFGRDILDEEGNLKRRLLADRAFATPEGTKALSSITHPEIFRRMEEDRAKKEKEGHRLYFIDGAVIIGTPFEALCQEMILVVTPREESIRRICARDGISPQMAARRLDAQPPQEELEKHAHYILKNDGTPEQLADRTMEILSRL